MTEKDLREIKRRFCPERSNIPRIVGCFVNENKQIIARITQSLGLGESTVSDKLLSTMKKVLSGSLGTQLNEVSFSTRQVSESDEHKLLTRIVKSELRDGELLEKLYSRIIESVKLDSNFVILLANDVYDVPSFTKDGETGESNSSFSYVISAVCPVRSLPEVLSFREADSLFYSLSATGVLGSPELGFMFPTFDERRTNIYSALYYTRSISENYPDFMKTVFASEPSLPPKAQKESFSACLSSALGNECSLDLVRSIHAEVAEMIESHKESRDPEPLTLTKSTVKTILENCGVAEEKLCEIESRFDESFGKNAELVPKNVLATKKFELKSPEVSIKVDPEHRDAVKTAVIGGEKYVMIRVSGAVEVNGISITIDDN